MIKSNKGFTLMLALIILVLLSVMLGLFITMVTVNLRQANRFIARTNIEQIANDGIEYCNKMLLYSAEGADWRPVPDNISMKEDWVLGNIDNKDTGWVNVAPKASDCVSDLQNLSETDPDYEFLIPYWSENLYKDGVIYAGPNGGYTRVNTGENRFLIRVTYSPVAYNVNDSKFYANYLDQACKYIKIESIARKGNVDEEDPTTLKPYTQGSNNQAYLLAYKPIGITDYGRFITNKDRQNRTFELGNGLTSEEYGRINTRYTKRGGSLRVNGDVNFSNVKFYLRALKYKDHSGTTIYSPRDIIETTGSAIGLSYEVYDQDNKTPSVSREDFVKEGSENGSMKELEAPLIDLKLEKGGLTRYRQLTKNTGKLLADGKKSGEYGWGDGIYINNENDVQKESETLFGGYTLRADWLTPGNRISDNWRGPYYIPKGVVITLYTDKISIQRTDFNTQNISTVWRDENGVLKPSWGSTCVMDYPKNGVIYAEGNIRIKGMLKADTQLTVVSNENIYIEGNLLKNRPSDTNILDAVDTESYKIADPGSAISLLARKNVVVNPTLFMRPQMDLNVTNVREDVAGTNEPPFHLRLNPLDIGKYFQWKFQFGPYESEDELFKGKEWNFAIRHSADIDTVDAYLQTFNYQYNDWKSIPWGKHVNYYTGDTFGYNYTVDGGNGLGINSDDGWKYKNYIYRLYDYDFYSMSVATDQYLKIFLDHNSKGEYILGNCFVNPMDVRIEALMYAQNGSFFVIPGYWFETDNTKDYNNDFWLFGKPLDCRIIIDGCISENAPASRSDQIAWMQKWGETYHPDTNEEGSDIYGKTSYHGGKGLTILYDDNYTYPLTGDEPVRYDEWGRVLPITPYLPVSKTLVYKGNVD